MKIILIQLIDEILKILTQIEKKLNHSLRIEIDEQEGINHVEMLDGMENIRSCDISETREKAPASLQDVSKKDSLLSIDAACAFLGIVRSTLAQLRREGHITDVKKGRSVRFRFSELKLVRKWYSIPKGKG